MEKEEVHWQDIVGLAEKLERVDIFTAGEIKALQLVFGVAGEALAPTESVTQTLGTFYPGPDPVVTRRAFKVYDLYNPNPVHAEPPDPEPRRS